MNARLLTIFQHLFAAAIATALCLTVNLAFQGSPGEAVFGAIMILLILIQAGRHAPK